LRTSRPQSAIIRPVVRSWRVPAGRAPRRRRGPCRRYRR
jgi:hypothetical protein